ncbi:dTMP kinase [Bradyrhizobium sp. WD16]|uniref:dTMP kinase n=1 Tax=Bradyrhizobium sp. WD16 TaxID=1521768 RepID=UPI0020A55790|nr:dTMP kinase [Bradyrhizobium sp. WD16]UTD29153.1 dTMP kinase [Bradyrhizobium sp. WD16]
MRKAASRTSATTTAAKSAAKSAARSAAKSAATAASARGRFITFEGGEGAGKSTQIKSLADRLAEANIRAVTTREPGGSPGAEIMRHLVLSGVGKVLGADLETLLFAAARADHVKLVIEPSLARGVWVLCDRFSDSTRVYQGSVGRVDPMLIEALDRVTIDGLRPDLTLVLDVPVGIGLARAAQRRGDAEPDRFESEDVAFHEKLREGFRALTESDPERCVLVDANADADTVASRVWQAVQARFPELARKKRRVKERL